jgi:hypothetical protein
LRQALSLGLFWIHFARISLRRSTVSFILDIFGSGAGAAVCADAVTVVAETSSMAARQTLVRSIRIPLVSFL